MKSLQGCELFGLLKKTYQPSGSNWAWKWDEQLTSLQHKQSESIPSFWGQLQDLADNWGTVAWCLVTTTLFSNFSPLFAVVPTTTTCSNLSNRKLVCTRISIGISPRSPLTLSQIVSTVSFAGPAITWTTMYEKKGAYPAGVSSSTKTMGGWRILTRNGWESAIYP
jgi:hypothetical protein